jgi:glycine/D-amino acid oxidase-like deaminating enzyme
LLSGLTNLARARGAELQTAVPVSRVTHAAGRVTGVLLRDGVQLGAADVVLAAGAWNSTLGLSSGFELPLTPLRRHLVQLEAAGYAAQPVIWRLEDELYYRPEASGVLASPCDETAWPAEAPPTDPAALVNLTEKLRRSAPQLVGARVQRAWACLRTFAVDRELVAGADPRVRGLHWLAGLGGRGMSVALAAAEVLVANLLGAGASQHTAALSPTRLC